MKEIYYCDTCSVFFPRAQLREVRESNTSEFWGAVRVVDGVVLECPTCGGDVEERLPCSDCAAVLPEPGSDHCAPCMEITDYVENWRAHKDADRARARFVYRAAEPTRAEKTAAAVGIAVRLSGMLLLSKLFNGKK